HELAVDHDFGELHARGEPRDDVFGLGGGIELVPVLDPAHGLRRIAEFGVGCAIGVERSCALFLDPSAVDGELATDELGHSWCPDQLFDAAGPGQRYAPLDQYHLALAVEHGSTIGLEQWHGWEPVIDTGIQPQRFAWQIDAATGRCQRNEIFGHA